ncbi:MAG: alpha/beta fold hydrolase [Candidatus Thorarchaeota archaeon]
MKNDLEQVLKEMSVSDFEKRATAKELIMSDTATIKVFHSKAPEKTRNGYTLVLIPGWATIVPSWDEFLMEAADDFDVVYFESREKESCKLTKESKVGMDRMAYDIKDVIDQLKIDETKLVLFGSCLGATTIVVGLYNGWYNPFMPVLVAPPPRFEVPPVLRQLIPIAPTFLFTPAKPILIWWVKKFKTESPKQAAKYIRSIEEANPKRWKKVGLPLAFKRFWKIFPHIDHHNLLVAMEEDKMHDVKTTQKIAKMMKNSVYVNLNTNENTHAAIMVKTIREYLPQFIGKNHPK